MTLFRLIRLFRNPNPARRVGPSNQGENQQVIEMYIVRQRISQRCDLLQA